MDIAAVRAIPESELIPVDAHSFGHPATVKYIMFADGECTYCADSFQHLFKFAKTHQGIQLVVRHFPLSIHAGAFDDAVGAEIASERGKFWEYEEALYSNGSHAKPIDILVALGWKRQEIERRIKGDAKLIAIVNKDMSVGSKLGIDGTPALVEIIGSRRFVLTDLYVRQHFRL